MADLNFRVQRVIENEVSVIQDQLKRNGVDIFHGMAKFIDPHHLRVENNNGFAELEGEFVDHRDGNEACGQSQGADQRAQHHQ